MGLATGIFLTKSIYANTLRMAHSVDTPTVAKQDNILPSRATFAALLVGAVNIIGTAALLKGWLIDIGIRYYDGMSIVFNLPRGVFIPSETRLLQTGYTRVSATLGETTGRFIIASLLLLLLSLTLYLVAVSLINHLRYQQTGKAHIPFIDRISKIIYKLGLFFITVFSMLTIIGSGILAYVLVYQAPKCAYQFGSYISRGYLRDLSAPGCPKCQLFGDKKARGVAVFADDKSLFIGTVGPGLTRVPLDGIVINPQKIAYRPNEAASDEHTLDFKCDLKS